VKPFHIKYVGVWAGEGFVLGAIFAPSISSAYNPFLCGLVLAFATVVCGLVYLLFKEPSEGSSSVLQPEWLWYVCPIIALFWFGLWCTLCLLFMIGGAPD